MVQPVNIQIRIDRLRAETLRLGTNLGSVVMIVLPDADSGSSSFVLAFPCSSSICGSTNTSMNRLINVDFPVLTGPTTPMYISPFVLACMSLYK